MKTEMGEIPKRELSLGYWQEAFAEGTLEKG